MCVHPYVLVCLRPFDTPTAYHHSIMVHLVSTLRAYCCFLATGCDVTSVGIVMSSVSVSEESLSLKVELILRRINGKMSRVSIFLGPAHFV